MKKPEIGSRRGYSTMGIALTMALLLLMSSFALKTNYQETEKPQLKIYTENGELDIEKGLRKDAERLYLRMVPASEDQLSYKVSKAEITLVSGGIGENQVEISETVELGPIISEINEKSVLVIEVKECLSKNEAGQVNKVTDFQRFLSIPIKQK